MFSFSSVAQLGQQKGEIYTIKGIITDKKSNSVLPQVILELIDKEKNEIKVVQSDFDGAYIASFCSKKLMNENLFIKVTKALYNQEVFSFKVVSDTIINIQMNSSNSKKISEKEFEKYRRTITKCGLIVGDTEYDLLEYETNSNTYMHYCTGEIKTYRELIDNKEILSHWIMIEK
ncbi:hypothetical protein [Tenacibaculum sp. M341]|uniref:hypothetical protein n=1 Tax=Tenacibaculum sp. M341 TaxID=2530339 RepID=UPI001043BACC|nr:hypothetical protein [Tenacibaculum sp. M341]TCI94904.1 hypothetical protein EYW44_00865 [Tenacibaculum sp. M341]